MTTAKMSAKIVRIRIEEGKTGLFYAKSPDLKGLLVAEPTLDALEREIPSAIVEMYSACGVDVVVSRVGGDDDDDGYHPWVAFPADIARKALESRAN